MNVNSKLKKKATIVKGVCLIGICILMAGCQPTPEKSAVISQAEDVQEKISLEEETGIPGEAGVEFNVPERWDENTDLGNG